MTRAMVIVFVCLGGVAASSAQAADDQSKAAEKELRDLIAKRGAGAAEPEHTDEFVLVTGLSAKPLVGKAAVEAWSKTRGKEIAAARPNEKREFRPQRIVAARSGDLAYEIGEFTVSFDGKDGKPTSFTGDYLRAWRKQGATWREDAFFARPREEPAK